MIVPMKKVSLVILKDKKEDTLKKLRKLGVLHIEITEGSGERLEELKDQISMLSSTIFSVGKDKKNEQVETVTAEEALSIARNIESLGEEAKALTAEQISLTTELARIQGWGEIHPEEIKALAHQGIDISLYELPRGEYELLGDNVRTIAIEKTKSSVKCFVIRFGLEGEEEVIDSLKAYRVALPQTSTGEIQQKIADISERIKAIDDEVAANTRFVEGMKGAIQELEK